MDVGRTRCGVEFGTARPAGLRRLLRRARCGADPGHESGHCHHARRYGRGIGWVWGHDLLLRAASPSAQPGTDAVTIQAKRTEPCGRRFWDYRWTRQRMERKRIG